MRQYNHIIQWISNLHDCPHTDIDTKHAHTQPTTQIDGRTNEKAMRQEQDTGQ